MSSQDSYNFWKKEGVDLGLRGKELSEFIREREVVKREEEKEKLRMHFRERKLC